MKNVNIAYIISSRFSNYLSTGLERCNMAHNWFTIYFKNHMNRLSSNLHSTIIFNTYLYYNGNVKVWDILAELKWLQRHNDCRLSDFGFFMSLPPCQQIVEVCLYPANTNAWNVEYVIRVFWVQMFWHFKGPNFFAIGCYDYDLSITVVDSQYGGKWGVLKF